MVMNETGHQPDGLPSSDPATAARDASLTMSAKNRLDSRSLGGDPSEHEKKNVVVILAPYERRPLLESIAEERQGGGGWNQ